MRGIAIDCKHYIIILSQSDNKFAAIKYTLIETSKIISINTQVWRTWVLAWIADNKINMIDECQPHNYND